MVLLEIPSIISLPLWGIHWAWTIRLPPSCYTRQTWHVKCCVDDVGVVMIFGSPFHSQACGSCLDWLFIDLTGSKLFCPTLMGIKWLPDDILQHAGVHNTIFLLWPKVTFFSSLEPGSHFPASNLLFSAKETATLPPEQLNPSFKMQLVGRVFSLSLIQFNVLEKF